MNKTFRHEKIQSAEMLFYIGFIPLLFVLFWKTTAFPQYDKAELLVMAVFTACVALKMLFFDHWTLRELLVFLVCIAVAGLSCYKSRFTRPLVLVTAVFGARELDGRKILKCWLVMSVMNLLLAVPAGLLGIIENYIYPRHENGFLSNYILVEKAYALGLIYKTDCVARFFFTLLVWFYLRASRLRWFEYFGATTIAVLLFIYTDCRLDVGCILIMVALFAVNNRILKVKKAHNYFGVSRGYIDIHRGREAWVKILSVSAILSFPLFAAVSLALCKMYRPGGFLLKVDEWTSFRLSIGNRIFTEYGVTVFGQPFSLYGFGAHGEELIQAVEGASYNFVDISYQYVLVLYGVVFFMVIMAGWLWLAVSKRHDTYLMLCLILTAFNCMIAHHMTEIAYIPFIMLAFTTALPQTALSGKDEAKYEPIPVKKEIPDISRLHL